MFHNVLVGIDQKTRGRDAIALAVRLLSLGGEIEFAHVYPKMDADSAAVLAATREFLESVISESGVKAHPRWIAAASVGDGLRTLAQISGADLVVVGASTRTRSARFLIGNPTTDVLRARCSVAIAPLGYANESVVVTEIGVAYDGSRASTTAFWVARALADAMGAHLTAYYVAPLDESGQRPRRRDFPRAIGELAAATTVMRRKLHSAVDGSVGVPAAELAEFSKQVQLLVTGGSGKVVGKLVHPGTIEALADQLHCPLLVVTKGSRQRTAAHPATTSDLAGL